MTTNTEILPFRVEVPQADLDLLRDRLSKTLWPNEIPGSGRTYGVPVDYVRKLTEYWLNEFDWRAVEARLNSYPQFTTEIDGQNIHFLHVRSENPDALPLILTHGWPGSIVEYLDVIEPLAESFHLVIPSIPGFGFSGPTSEAGWSRYRVAAAWKELMSRLGYTRYGAVGNDGGSLISPEVGRLDPEHVVGVHVTQIFSFPSGDPAEFVDLTEEEAAALEHLKWFWDTMGAFNQLQAQQPQTLAFALADSPAGLLAWNSQLFGEDVSPDFVITNVAIYWLTGTSGSSVRFYLEDDKAEHPTEPTTVPIGVAGFAGDFASVRRFAERDHKNLVHWTKHDRGGHYAAHQAPDLLVPDIREFFAKLG